MLKEKIKILPSFLCLFLLTAPAIRAQKPVTDFGVFTPEEIKMKQCDFDKDADAVVLFDKAHAGYNDNYNLVTEHRIRFKILKERGIERGDIHITYYSDDSFEEVFGIDAIVLSFNGQNNEVWSKLDRKSVYKKKINRYYSEITFALPNVKVGSIIEYKYESQMKHYGGLREWIFQSDMPVVLSSYQLVIVPNAEFAYTVYKTSDLHIDVKNSKEDGSVSFEMSNIPGLRDEAFMGSAHDYLQRVKFQFSAYKNVSSAGYGTSSATTTKYSTTWKELARDMMDEPDFGNQINKNLAGSEALQLEWAKQPSAFAKMKSIHEYVRSHISWDHINTKYASDGVKDAWEKKIGSSGAVNLILINLLKTAGLAAEPLLVSERGHGKVDTTYPYVDQFNKVVAYVVADEHSYILDATDRETPSFVIPFDLLNTTGFIVNKKTAALLKIADNTRMNSNLVNMSGTITKEGTMQLEASVYNYNYSKIDKAEQYKKNAKKYEKEFFEPYALTTLDTFSVEDLENDSLPLTQRVKIGNYTLHKTGDYFLLNYNLFTGLNKNPFMSEHRFSDINFGSKYLYQINGRFSLPDNLTPEALPKSVRLVLPDKTMSIVRQVEQKNDLVEVVVRVEFSQSLYKPDDYLEVQAFYKQMLSLLNEPIVLKEK